MKQEKLPIPKLVAEIEKRMRQLNYSEHTIEVYWTIWNNMIQYAKDEGITSFSVAFGEKFLFDRYGIDVNKGNGEQGLPATRVRAYKRPIDVLSEFQNTGTIIRKNRSQRVEIPAQFREAVNHYIAFCRQRFNAESTINIKIFAIKTFVLYLDQMHVTTSEAIDGSHISGFIEATIGWSQRTVGNVLATLRHFFHFLHQECYHPKDLSISVPRVNCSRIGKLPQIWTAEEVASILASVDRGNAAGKRDYAILLLVTHLGLRDSDVQNLKFEHIHWAECLIRFHQTKTGRLLELPLDEEAGDAIIDYLKYGRPKQDTSPYVFVRHKAPYGKCVNYYYIMRKYLSAANIRIDTTKPHGLHSLRHTLATRLLEQQIPLQTISQILGHTSANTTNIYLRVDLDSLRGCALNPEEVFVND